MTGIQSVLGPLRSLVLPRLIAGPLLARLFAAAAFALAGASASGALGREPRVEFRALAGGFPLVSEGRAAHLQMDPQDHAGVLRAVNDLQADVARVTGATPEIGRDLAATPKFAVIIGTIGKSRAIDRLIREHKIDAAPIAGKWEAFLVQVVDAPAPGIERALVIAGSDKRGTIYGVYDLSEEIGVSPWYWWADVPVRHRDALVVRPGRVIDEGPVVKYRGIFLNDEAPALTNWAREKFGGFNHKFYEKLFELILRLRGNYLWPAMWQPTAFNDDDPENPRLADEYGVVMGTSHHEPLMRAHDEWDRHGNKGPWDYSQNDVALREFWKGGMERTKNFENIVSIGMRGDGDQAMSAETNTALLERIVADQRKIITEVTGKPPAEVPQLWALYKEVQAYYENGMRVPDDVTLLWCDDNWANIRRLPTPEERKRKGGAGVYYHFDYVGGPRNYKWLNVTPLTKVWEQMNLAWQYDANRIWIVNVGDLKPMEFPTEFFLNFAWNPARWPYEKLGDYSRAWAAREFGAEHASEIAALIHGYTKLNRRRTPELLAPDTYSLVNYRESDRIVAEWSDLVARAGAVNTALAPEYRDAFFQLVQYPVQAGANLQNLYVAAGLNRLYARQGRVDANAQAARVRALFAEDARLAAAYHAIGGGKWNHMADQVKLGYVIWQQPFVETMPAVSEVRPAPAASMGVAVEGVEFAGFGAGGVRRAGILPPLDSFQANESRWIEVFNRGVSSFAYAVTADQPWITITQPTGTVADKTVRIEINADWARVPAGQTQTTLTVDGGKAGRFTTRMPVNKSGEAARGFVETDRFIAIEAPHFDRAVTEGGVEWRTLKDFGATVGGVTTFPVEASPRQPGGRSPRLEYDVTLFSAGEVTVELTCAPSLDFQPGDGLRLAVSFDDAPPQIQKLDTWATLQTWEKAVSENSRRVVSKHKVTQPGHHVLKFWLVTPGVVLERIVIDAGGVRPSYLGPPESPRIPAAN